MELHQYRSQGSLLADDTGFFERLIASLTANLEENLELRRQTQDLASMQCENVDYMQAIHRDITEF
jgi:hypothetical protein